MSQSCYNLTHSTESLYWIKEEKQWCTWGAEMCCKEATLLILKFQLYHFRDFRYRAQTDLSLLLLVYFLFILCCYQTSFFIFVWLRYKLLRFTCRLLISTSLFWVFALCVLSLSTKLFLMHTIFVCSNKRNSNRPCQFFIIAYRHLCHVLWPPRGHIRNDESVTISCYSSTPLKIKKGVCWGEVAWIT